MFFPELLGLSLLRDGDHPDAGHIQSNKNTNKLAFLAIYIFLKLKAKKVRQRKAWAVLNTSNMEDLSMRWDLNFSVRHYKAEEGLQREQSPGSGQEED